MEIYMSHDVRNQIFCVMDIQGFSVEGKFYPRELSIVNNDLNITWNVDPELEVTENNRISIGYHVRDIHGLSVKPDYGPVMIKSSTLAVVLKILSSILFTEEKPYIAVKNQQLAAILRNEGLQFVNLEKGNCVPPAISDLEKDNIPWMCILHSNPVPRMKRCALRKSVSIWKWLNQCTQ